MDQLDITPAFIDIFKRINKHLDLLPFQKLLNDQNSTLTDEEKQEMKSKINESSKKVRQLNLVLDELKDQILAEIEKVQVDFEEKNRDLDALEEHLNYVRSNQFNANQKATAVLREQIVQENELNNQEGDDSFGQLNSCESDLMMPKENRNANYPTESTAIYNNPPKRPNKAASLRPPTSSIARPGSGGGGPTRKPDQFAHAPIAGKTNGSKPNGSKPNGRNDEPARKEKVKNVDNIYINYPQINYISLNEFNYIPKYMKGRLSFETCNKLVDDFNKAIECKYKFMMIPTSKYSNDELLKYTLYKNQEDDETKGLFFVTPKDLHEYSKLQISANNTKIFIQCVRHCKRIKEIRGMDRLIRYVVLN